MLKYIVDTLIIGSNLNKITSNREGGMLHLHRKGDEIFFGSAGLYKGCSCHEIGFDYDLQSGKIKQFTRHSSQEQGAMKIILNSSRIIQSLRLGLEGADFPMYRIFDFAWLPNTTENAKCRIMEAANLYNSHYGFDPDYNGFAIGNFLD